jgi:hypothetical protein
VIKNVQGTEIGKLWVDTPTSPENDPPVSPNKAKRGFPDDIRTNDMLSSPKGAKQGISHTHSSVILLSPSKVIKCF